MLFSSITFLYYFLPVVLLLSYAAPEKAKNLILFLASLLFYFWGEPGYSILLIAAVCVGYTGGRCIEKAEKKRRIVTGLFVAAILGMLLFFKYTDFLLKSIGHLTGADIPLLRIALPIGISFYSFQIISYLIDVERKTVVAEKNFIDFAAYVTMFPQLIAGPIVRFSEVGKQMKARKVTVSQISDGAGRFVCGLCKKVLIADSLGTLVTWLSQEAERITVSQTMTVRGGATFTEGIGTAGYWVLAAAYMLQLYYDFSGYSDMAIGMGQMLGFSFPENFLYPYISKSISEFWRRWHITLGGWFRDYVYIPLGGNRVNTVRWCLNMIVVWLLSGLWHGAGWNFALWGIYYGMFLCLEKLLGRAWNRRKTGSHAFKQAEQSRKKAGARKRYDGFKTLVKGFFCHSYVSAVVLVSFVIFRVEKMDELGRELLGLAGRSGTAMSTAAAYEIRSNLWLLLIAAIGATPLVKTVWNRLSKGKRGEILQTLFTVGGLLLATAFLLGSSAHPFLYFRF